MNERLNKVLAQAGLGSRRSCDQIIESGRVMVNGKPARLGIKVTKADMITVDGQPLEPNKPQVVLIKLNKPKGVTVTKKDQFAPVTVMDFLPEKYQHLYPVGRLDKMSSGLLLLTNDGQLALKLTHPRYEHEKEYDVRFKSLNNRTLDSFMRDMYKLSHHIIDKDAQSKPIKIEHSHFNEKDQTGHVTVILKEGKNRQIRRLFLSLGYFVTDLTRTRIGKLKLADLKPGAYAGISSNDL